MHFRGTGDLEEVHADAGRIEPHGLEHGFLDHQAEPGFRQFLSVDIGHVSAQHEGGLVAAWDLLEMAGLPQRELNRIRRCIHEGLHHRAHVFDALKETGLVEKAVIHGDVETAVGLGVEEAIEAVLFHGAGWESGKGGFG